MDKRYNTLTVPQQLALRRQAVQDVLTHTSWSLRESIRHLKKTLRITSAELAKLSGLSTRTLQDIEQGRSEGTVQTMNRILGVLGLKLGVVQGAPPPGHVGGEDATRPPPPPRPAP
jgi:transcriptional regulator with XRE-family HTH domain